MNEYGKEYYQKNKDIIKEKYEKNKPFIIDYNKDYYQKNKERIKAKNELNKPPRIPKEKNITEELITCECGSVFEYPNKFYHYKTKKHKYFFKQRQMIDTLDIFTD